MAMMRILLVSLLLLAAPPAHAQTARFEVGQVWSLQPPMDPAARIWIGRIEDNGQTIHISLWGQPVETTGPLSSPLTAGHLPISAEALGSSVDRVVEEMPPADLPFEEGYADWSNARGGVFTISVADIVVVMVEMIAAQQSPAEKN